MAEETKNSTVIPVLGGDRPVSPLPRVPHHPGAPPPIQHVVPGAALARGMWGWSDQMHDAPGHVRQELKTIGDYQKKRSSVNIYDLPMNLDDVNITSQRLVSRYDAPNPEATVSNLRRVKRNLWYTEGDSTATSDTDSEIDDWF